jgi:hypothetical protein
MNFTLDLPGNNNIVSEIYKETTTLLESFPKNKQSRIAKLIEKYEDENSINSVIEIYGDDFSKLKEKLIQYKIDKMEYIKSIAK